MTYSKAFNYLFWLCIILLIKAGFIFFVIFYAGIGLGPDEAQYWTWSQALDWGYYSKPPGIAWQIWVGTKLFGNTELGVRFGAIILAYASTLAIYGLARSCQLKKSTAFWAAILFAFSPLGMLASFFAITDGGLFLFWTMACSLVALSLSQKRLLNYPLLGGIIFAGALFKWPIYFFWLPIFALWPFVPSFRSPKAIAGVAISLLGLLPSAIWNWQHDWATFRHVFSTVQGAPQASAASGNFVEFAGSQFALLSPILFILICLSLWTCYKERKNLSPALLFCGSLCFAILAGFAFKSFFQKIQGNWSDFAYATGVVVAAWYGCERLENGRRWILAGLAFSCFLCLFAFSLPTVQSRGILPISYKINPFRHNLGWERLDSALAEAGYDPEENFIFGDKYQTASIMSFYGEKQKRAYFLNLHGIRKNQFSYWPSMSEEQTGKTGFFILAENIPYGEEALLKQADDYKTLLSPYFERVEFHGLNPLFFNRKLVKGALIFKCTNYNGRAPAEKSIY